MQIKTQTKTNTFAEVESELKADNFAPETLGVDKMLIEINRCQCGGRFDYRGYNNALESRAYGVCECGNWKLFWTIKSVLQFPRKRNLQAV